MIVAAAAAVLLSVADPRGDARGDGAYTLPARVRALDLDLRSMSALDVNGRLELRVELGRLDNTAGAPNGFSVPALDLFVGDPGRGGEEKLGDTGFSTPPGRGWRYHLHVDGWSARLEGADAAAGDVRVRTDGTTVVVDTPIPSGTHTYWAVASLYDPLSPDRLAHPVARPTAFEVGSDLPDPPPAIDLLSPDPQAPAYRDRVAAPLEARHDRSPVLLITGLFGACLALGATVWGLFSRR